MEILLYIKKPDLPLTLGWTHDATDWEIASNISFAQDAIVFSSREDTVNLTAIFTDLELDVEKDYFARSRVICNKAIFDWTDLDLLRINNHIEVVNNYDIPSKPVKPELTTPYANNVIPANGFSVSVSAFNTTGNGTNKNNSYILTTLDGYVIHSDIDNPTNLTNKEFNDLTLEPNESYLLQAFQRSTSNDITEPSKMLVKANDVKGFKFIGTTINPDITDGLAVTITDVINFKTMYVKLYVNDNDFTKLILERNANSMSLVIPNTMFSLNRFKKYNLGIEVEHTDGTLSGMKYWTLTFH